jgi:glycosyltransferase involved in cell wall biosynthesis
VFFWQHGASIPQGGNTVGDVAYRTGSPYTHFWNVSKACAEYLAQKYKLKKIDIVHPFFDTEVMREYQKLKTTYQRNGLLILARRGQKYLPTIIKKFCPRNKITVMHGYFHEREFFEELLRHRFFISIDDGIDAPVWYKQIIRSIKKMFDPALREKELHRNIWLVPSGHLLGFPVSAAEAATLGTAVIGFAMGGGLEWMNTETCFLAQDRDQNSLLSAIEKAINTPSGEVDRVVKNAEGAVGVFTKEHTWTQMKESLRFSV